MEKLFRSKFWRSYYSKELKKINFLKKRIKRKPKKKSPYFSNYLLEKIKREIINVLKEKFAFSEIALQTLVLTLPPEFISADFSFSCFSLAKEKKEKPEELAKKIAEIFNQTSFNFIERSETVGSFVNLFLRREKVYPLILKEILKLKERYGENNSNYGKIVLIDYSSPNIAKPIGVGHLRSTIIGQALANIYQATGAVVIKDNHLGDWGTNFGELFYAYQKWVNPSRLRKNPLQELKNLYVKFHQEAEKNPLLEEKAREMFKRLEEGDEKLLQWWQKFRNWSISSFQKIYRRLKINFDLYLGESFYLPFLKDILQECLKKKIARQEKNSSLIVVENLNNLPSFLLQKEDGSSLYLTRDLATLVFRIKNFHPHLLLYVVGSEQKLHFQQLFTLAEKLGYLNYQRKALHIDFGLVLAEGKKMATRKGSLVELEELIEKIIQKAKCLLKEKNPSLNTNEIKRIAEIIGLGALIYNDLSRERSSNISFEWEKMLNFEKGSAVYLQYTYVRAKSILKKAKNFLDSKWLKFEDESEWKLARQLMLFPSVVVAAQKRNAPHLIASYLEDLAQLFSNFYEKMPVLYCSDENLKKSRIILVKSTSLIIKKGLGLLQIETPEKM